MVVVDLNVILTIVSTALGIASIVFGQKYSLVKKLLKQLVDAAEDDNISEDEFQAIKETVKQITGYISTT